MGSGVANEAAQNAYVESFNGKSREECRGKHRFTTLAHARAVVVAWCQDYEERSPYNAQNCFAPSEFAAKHRSTAKAWAIQDYRYKC